MLKIGILSRSPQCYSTRRLVEASLARGHSVEVINYLNCYMSINSQASSIFYQGEALPTLDAIIPRIGASHTFYGCSVLRQFETQNIYSINSSIAVTRSRDKLRALQLLSRKGIGLPMTVFAHSGHEIKDLIRMVGGAPLVIKLLEGTQGIGVVLAETKKAAESVIEAFYGLKADFLIQEYIKEAQGADIRCFVVGNRVVAAMKRQGAPGEFRSNIHRGGYGAPIRISKQERDTAIAASKIMGLNLAGVDLLRSDQGPLVMEVNSSPGLEGIEKTTEKDVASMIIQHIESQAHLTRSPRAFQG